MKKLILIMGICILLFVSGCNKSIQEKECPYIFYKYDIEKEDRKQYVVLDYNNSVFRFWHKEDYFSLAYDDYNFLKKNYEINVDFRDNTIDILLTDRNCLDKYALYDYDIRNKCYKYYNGTIKEVR